ncbi:MAG: low molecular weight protein-tyrosine-phosphatase [Bacteroidales bacterium]
MKVLFLCNANMCRSPVAEGLLKLILKKRNIDAEVDSAGFEAYYINESPEDRVVKKVMERGIDISRKRVRLFSQSDFDKFDKIYVMDMVAYRNALEFARDEHDKSKIDFLMNLVHPGKNEPFPNPFIQDESHYEQTLNLLHKACEKIADQFTEESLN